MRIQHNISAMNAYRNFNTNNSKLTKNLEKLSTGYKINRAGDDAAGLAISEKMRAQITGLEGATKNAKDGISLIQTAEGALTEVHDMLNRMVTLTEQSANGTYDDTLDRAQLQKEVEALKSEIDRVADSTNYNGIKLLDGSLSGAGNMKGSVSVATVEARQNAVQSTAFAQLATGNSLAKGDKISYTVSWKNADGSEESATVDFTVGKSNSVTGDTAADNASALIAADGTKYALTAKEKFDDTELKEALISELNKNAAFSAKFTASAGTAGTASMTIANGGTTAAKTLQIDTKVKGSSGSSITGLELAWHDLQDDGTYNVEKITEGTGINGRQNAVDESQELNLKNIRVLVTADVTKTDGTIQNNIFEVGGKKFALFSGTGAEAKDIDKMKSAIGSDVTIIQLQGASNATTAGVNYTANTTDAQIIAGELARVTGMNFTQGIGNDGLKKSDLTTKDAVLLTGGKDKLVEPGKGKALMLQVGDTSDDWNRVGVEVGDMHVAALGVADIDISTQDGAASAVSTIKDAINKVSDTRGGLGALQNRLDHTINNLGVMRENIQSAEGLIRDTDVAEEMTTYTKNNILNQAAQAMLAQANQLPQGVLQLLG